ncbi:MAG: TrkH family potassium uptake protein, partial [Candidatus Omnitrophica bacterium]|nr:TrkH family potassium uptake protein [Candidatus Omnitrophota bacterium]
IVILAISFFVRGVSGSIKLYLGEARDEKILPNVISTARFIWLVSLIYLILGTLILGICGIFIGMKPFVAFFHGLCIFMAGFDTGGFTPQSLGIMYYRSPIYEFFTLVIMLLGAFNFRLHYSLWTGNLRSIYRDIESKTFFFSCIGLFLLCLLGLKDTGVYPQALSLFRKGAYILLSAHTGCGYQNIYPQEFLFVWKEFSLIAVILAMSLGGAVCSTTGAIKVLRVGILFKALRQDIKRFVLPRRAIFTEKFYHFREIFLEDRLVRSSLLIILCYIALYLIGALVGVFLGYPFLSSLFESTSAGANVGLSCGITDPGMPWILKIVYILQMWIGRLEFISIFGLVGFVVSFFKGE